MDISQRRQTHVYSLVALAAAALIAFASPGARAQNLLTNGDFSNAFTGWTTVKVIPSFNNLPNILIFSSSNCVPSQAGNPYASLDVPYRTQAHIEQAVELEGDAMLSLRVWGQLQPAEAIISIVDEDGVEHFLDRFVAVRMIQSYTFPGPVFQCTGALPQLKSYAVTGFGGQTVKVRIAGYGEGQDGVFVQFDDVELAPAEPSLETSIEVDPAEVELDEEFTLTVKVKNAGEVDLTDVGPTSAVEATSDDGGEIEVLSGPVPTSVATLAAGGTAEFVYQMKATSKGTVKLAVEIAGENDEGDTVVADAVCALPAPARAPGPGRAVASQTTGCADTVTIGAPCKIELVDVSPPIYVARGTGNTIEVGGAGGPALACGEGGTCKTPRPSQRVTRVGEIAIAQLETEARQTRKNVGQEVSLRADVELAEGLTLQSLDWSVGGETIEWYTDVSGYTAGNPTALSFTHAEVKDSWEKTTDPGTEGFDRLTFFWKDTGTFTVEVEATAKDENDEEITCSVDLELEVERNDDDPDRQPEDFFTSCCDQAPERVRMEHGRWHDRVDATVPHAGDDWLNFHRAVVRVYDQWRDFFGYPAIGFYDGSGPFPSTEAGFDITEATRATDTPQCGAPVDPRTGIKSPLRPNCPMPGWFTDSGNGTARPLQVAVDGYEGDPEEDNPLYQGFFLYSPECFRARNYDNDLCWPAIRGPGDVADEVTCGPPPGLTGTTVQLPQHFELGASGRRIVDLAGVGQTRLSDFVDNVELGCIVTKSWHVQMHQLFNGAMLATHSSPKDPVFYRVHELLSGVTKPGAATTIYDYWEAAKATGGSGAPSRPGTTTPRAAVDTAAPELTLRFPYPEYPIAALEGVAVSFWEPVTGVDPSDLEVDGQQATSVEGSGKGPYVFRGFTPVVAPATSSTAQPVAVATAHSGHGAHGARALARAVTTASIVLAAGGIQDAAGNQFAGDSWTVAVEPDADDDGVADSVDNCPAVANPLQENSDVYHVHAEGSKPEEIGVGHSGMVYGDALGDACDTDDDDDGFSDQTEVNHGSDPKSRTDVPDPTELPGDADGDGRSNANDACFTDPRKTAPGVCGCGAPDRDSDGDGTFDCQDLCPFDGTKIEPGDCGCAFDEVAGDGGLACVESVLQPELPAQAIPTLSQWGLLLLALICAAASVRAIRSAP